MVRVILRGGLGNQMFQYAAGLAAAKRNGTQVVLDATFLNDRFPRKQFTYRSYDLDIFTLAPEFTALSNLSSSLPVPGLWLGLDLALLKLRDVLGLEKIVREKVEHRGSPAVMTSGPNVALWGFWQTPEYFAGIEDELRSAFRFRHPLAGEAAGIAEDMKKTNSVALHVRRGDYSLPKYANTYGATVTSYYDAAIALLLEKVRDAKFFVFSDDIEWCRANLKVPAGAVFVTRASEGPKASYHLQLMSLAKHNIIANSTFSWWGAWLNRNPHKIVIAPKRWYADGRSAGIVPGEWVSL